MSLTRNSKLIDKKFIQYLIPSIFMVFAMQFGSLIDGILIGNMLGSDALGATSLVLPILYVIQIPGFALGVGGSIVVANLLGKRDAEGAKKVYSFSMIVGVGVSLIFTAIAFFISRPLALLFGESIIDFTEPYVLMYLLTDPLVTIALLIGSFMAVDNNPKLSSLFYIVGNVAKVGLEILFIQVFKWGMHGAAASTGAGYFVGLIVVIFYLRSDKKMLKLTFKLNNCHVKEIFKASSTSALNLVLTGVQMLIINIFIGKLLTDPVDLLIYGLVANMVFIFDLLCGGIINLIPNICAIFYGEKDYYSLKSITKKIYWINVWVTVGITIFIAIFPNVYAYAFGYDASSNFDYAAAILRVYLLSFIPYEINKFSMNYYPSIDKGFTSIVTVLLREAIIVLPITIWLLFAQGLMGYSIACAVTEFATVVITYIFIFIYNKKKKNSYGIFMLDKVESQSYDVSIDNELNNASIISEQLTKYAQESGVNNRESQIVGLAAEEMVNNIITYGYKKDKHSYIDVNLRKVEDTLILRIRDDGSPFDPTKYEFDNNENYSTSGIKMIEKLTNKMTYMRILNLNNTIIEIKI